MLDLDATDHVLHGHQEGRFFHGYYNCYCYLPLLVFCGRHLLGAKLRRSNIDANARATEEIARIVGHIRSRWPDSGFARDELMSWAEAHEVRYVIGVARNDRLVAHVADALAEAETQAKATGRPARAFKDFAWRTRNSWSRERRIVTKAEWTKGKANPRFIVTSLAPGVLATPRRGSRS